MKQQLRQQVRLTKAAIVALRSEVPAAMFRLLASGLREDLARLRRQLRRLERT